MAPRCASDAPTACGEHTATLSHNGLLTQTRDDGNGCGLNGDLCRPFDSNTMTFRCPANCKRIQVLNPHAVGDQEISYKPLVIGGPTDEEETLENTYYRADSFICGAAIHAGFINDQSGGCGVLSFNGERSNYPSVNRKHINSIGFDSYFPRSFSFLGGTASKCRDLRWPLLGVSLTFTILLSLFTTSPAVFFSSTFLGIFFHVALASDPPNLTDYYAIVSIALGRFLPASFCMFAVYHFFVRRTLHGLHAQIEKTFLWLGGCWVGALNNYTFDKIPIERLTPHDLKQQPGAVPALIIIVLLLLLIAIGQAWCLRVEGRLPRYLAVYGIYIAVILTLVAIPKVSLTPTHATPRVFLTILDERSYPPLHLGPSFGRRHLHANAPQSPISRHPGRAFHQRHRPMGLR